MKKQLIIGLLGVFMLMIQGCSSSLLKGTWQYDGGIYNGNIMHASPDLVMQRTFTAKKYEAFVLEDGEQPQKYGSGHYKIQDSIFYITSEYNNPPSDLTGKTIVYTFKLDTGRLIINGTLPNGMLVEEHWKKIK
ncbi:MAG TPA: hypothetical protein VEV16_02690 [Daejeonella sp.]|nr:hypothetical protein [Daejeonella sp.]